MDFMKLHLFIALLFTLLFTACSTKPLEPVKFDEISRNISFTNEIKPILDKRCVACHSCYNSPCQLKLSSFEGVERGASKKIFMQIESQQMTQQGSLLMLQMKKSGDKRFLFYD